MRVRRGVGLPGPVGGLALDSVAVDVEVPCAGLQGFHVGSGQAACERHQAVVGDHAHPDPCRDRRPPEAPVEQLARSLDAEPGRFRLVADDLDQDVDEFGSVVRLLADAGHDRFRPAAGSDSRRSRLTRLRSGGTSA
jgi:hypothetical protein